MKLNPVDPCHRVSSQTKQKRYVGEVLKDFGCENPHDSPLNRRLSQRDGLAPLGFNNSQLNNSPTRVRTSLDSTYGNGFSSVSQADAEKDSLALGDLTNTIPINQIIQRDVQQVHDHAPEIALNFIELKKYLRDKERTQRAA